MRDDWHGLPVTTECSTAVAAYDDAVRSYVTYEADTPARVGHLMQVAPDLPMAHVLKGNLTLLGFKAATLPVAREALSEARRHERSLSWREQAHIAALAAQVEGDMDAALRTWEDIVDRHPADILAFRLHHFHAFWLGRPGVMADVVERTLPRYDRQLPAYGCLLACRCFANEELGNYVLAEAAGRQAIDIDPSDVWAAHAVAHVLEMQGRRGEGILWLDALEPHWTTKNNLKHHLWWHRGLYHFERGEFDAVLRLYDHNFRNHASPLTKAQPDLYIDVQNAVSMLYRLSRQQVDVGDRWRELAEHATARIGDCQNPFTLPHWMLALTRAGRLDQAEGMLEGMRAFSNTATGTLARDVRDIALPVCHAILASGRNDDRLACDTMRPVIGAMYRLGGSHAQQDLLEQVFLDCAMKAKSTDDVRLIIERVRGRHPVPPEHRRGYAQAARHLAGN